MYGGLSLNELETQIYGWAQELSMSVRCRQTNSEGEYVGWIHDAYGDADGVIVNPGAWSHYSYAIHDALDILEVPIVEVHLSNIRRARGVAPALGDRRSRRPPRDRERPDRLPRGARVPGGVGMSRLDRLRVRLDRRLLVTSLVNISYLTGFDSSNAALLVDPKGPVQLFTDFRYIEAAQGIPGVEAVEAKRTLMLDLAHRLRGKIAFEADILPFSQVDALGSGGLELVPASGIVEALRAIKDEDEIGSIRRAALAAERAFEALTAETWIGRSERELAWRLRQLMHAHGIDQLAFETAIATGANGSKPHAEPGDDIVEARTLVTCDWGARLEGYCSDCTRTLSTGELSKQLREIYDVCLEAQLAAVERIRPGMTGVEADAIARDVIGAAGYGERFGHGLGHGVGMLIHEAPRLSRESSDTLEAGHVVTIEPGIYLPGVGGVRIEDLAVVREDGLELLTSFPKDLIAVS